MNKKADLSINIIIVAAIALIILVIVSVLLFRSGGLLQKGTQTCEGVGGRCVDRWEAPNCDYYSEMTGGFWTSHRSATCPDSDQICCVPLRRD